MLPLSPKTPSLPRNPDRWLPCQRPALCSPAESYRMNKDPLTLSPQERIVRDQVASSDPFGPVGQAIHLVRPFFTSLDEGGILFAKTMNDRDNMVLTKIIDETLLDSGRKVSIGSIWTVGGLAPACHNVGNSKHNKAPFYTAPFYASYLTSIEEKERHEARLGAALSIDRVRRILEFSAPGRLSYDADRVWWTKSFWNGTEWIGGTAKPSRILDAPDLRSDFYCTLLAYSSSCQTIAVGLGPTVYGWSESTKAFLLENPVLGDSWPTSLAFSSDEGGKCILACGRSDGSLRLRSIYESTYPRFTILHPYPIAIVAWKPTLTMRCSRNPSMEGVAVANETLLAGDDDGNVFVYFVEWPTVQEVAKYRWSGAMTLIARIKTHSLKICCLSWSQDGTMFATGGNDDICCLYDSYVITLPSYAENEKVFFAKFPIADDQVHTLEANESFRGFIPCIEKYCWEHNAAVKAIAFCPWNKTLVATGAGNGDRCIRFFDATSGACLAMIDVSAQVTSLIWSTSQREIAATFGFGAQGNPFKVATFSWPECKLVYGVPESGEDRALYAVPYSSAPYNGFKQSKDRRKDCDGEECIVVASDDESIKFYQVWPASGRSIPRSLVGGSGILRGTDEIDAECDMIR
ncbi:WD40-repeat-containing domain protein [Xylogone sp. PMI_703]|nr:WD40-repeat-containing domain protein [Xylogone sp. PMI_703]